MTITFQLQNLAGGFDSLSGSLAGKRLLAALIAEAPRPSAPSPAFLDFDGLRMMTPSFFRDGPLAFRNYCRGTIPTLYPVLANVGDAPREEIALYLHDQSDAFWCCSLRAGVVSDVHLLGDLEPLQKQTLDLVQGGATTATELAAHNDAQIGITAWNNRLATLATRGLLVERRLGKVKSFTPVLEAP